MHAKHSSFFELHGVSTWLSTMQDLDTAKQSQTVDLYLFSLLFFLLNTGESSLKLYHVHITIS